MHGSPPISVARVAAAFVALHAALFALHWVWPIRLLSDLIPSSKLVGLANPLLFIAVAISFWGATAPTPGSPNVASLLRRARIACAALLVAVSAMYVLGTATGLPFGLDAVVRTAGQPPSHAFRLSPNSGLAFLLTGGAFLLFARPLERWRRVAFVACALAVAFIGLAGVVGHLVGLEALYRLPTINRILLPTAIAFTVVGAGLWGLHESVQQVPLHQIEGRITRRTLGVIALVALGCGVTGFAVMRENFEASFANNLQLTANTAATSLAHTVKSGLLFPKTIASRSAVAEALERLADRPTDEAARQFVQRVANNIVGAPLSSAEFYSVSDTLVARAGTSLRGHPAVEQPLKGSEQAASLGWNQGYFLVAKYDIHRAGRRVGRILTEQRLPLFDQLLANVRAANESSDAAVCGIEQARAVCAPTRFRQEVFSIPLYDADGQPAFPIVRALFGQTGVQFAKDPRGIEVVSAHAPIDTFGLGLAVKTDVSTLYAPLRSRLALLATAVVAIIALAIYALRSQVRPVVGRLAESERSLKAMIEQQAELVSLARPDGELTYVNPAYARHYGLRPEQMLGHNLFDHVEPADRDGVRNAIESVLRSGQAANHENRILRTDDGASRWIAWTNSRQSDRLGQPLLHSVGRDITERKQAEEQLAANARFVRGIADHVPALVTYVDSEQRYTFANAQFALRLGMDPAEMIGRTVRELRPEFYDNVLAPHLGAALRGEPRTFDGASVIDGRTVHYRVSYVPDLGPDGRVRGCYSLTVDITAVREAEQAAQQARLAADRVAEDLRLLFDAMPASLSLWSANGTLLAFNQQFAALQANTEEAPRVGVTLNALLRAAVRQGRVPEARGCEEAWIAQRLRQFQQPGESSIRAQAQGGWRRLLEVRLPDGRVLGHSVDVTELVTAQTEASVARQRLNDAIEALPAGFELYDTEDRMIIVNSTMKALYPQIADLLEQRLTFAQLVRANWERGGISVPDNDIERWIAERQQQRRQGGSTRTQQLAGGRWVRSYDRRTQEGGVVGVRIEITELIERDRELARLNDELQRMAHTDPLTLTANRRLFERRLAESFAVASAQGTPLALVLFDIDYFKRFNDHHGHPAGDACLRRVAAVLTAASRGPRDLTARLGGEEFVVLLPGADAAGACATVQRCMELLRDAAIAHGDSPLGDHVSFSAGIATLRPGEAPEQLLARADAALYEAKLAGRARWHLAG
jgi:diguanylate cyclase (GGDEF)-like protein/PAS domain S-box-containing protein